MKKVICFLLVLVMALGTVCTFAAQVPDEILVFKGVKWYIDDEGTLFIDEGPVNYHINSSWGYYGPWKDNTEIKRIIFPDNVEIIGERVFEGCVNLKEIVLPKNLEKLDEDAFLGCTGIERIIISKENPNFKTVDGVLFDGKGEILLMYGIGRQDTEYTIPEGTKEIAESSFENQTTLKKINFPSTLKTIKPKTFKGCTSLEGIELPDGVDYIGENAFENCENLSYIKMPPYVYLQNNPFYNTAFYNNAQNWDDYGLYINKHLLVIKDGATIKPDTVSIAGCFASDITSEEITIPGSVKSIGDKAFEGNKSIRRVHFEEELKILGHRAFYNSDIISVDLPQSLTTIGGEAFKGSDIESIVIPDNVVDIGESAFENCASLKDVTLGAKTGNIGKYAFENCSALTSITIPDSVWKIGDYAFYKCRNLQKINIGSLVYVMNEGVFMNCDSLSEVEISKDNPFFTSKDGVVFDKNGQKLIYYPHNKPLEHYVVPEGVKVIEERAIKNGKFRYITIPPSVNIIGSYNNCQSLSDIYYMGTREEWDKIAIDEYNNVIVNAVVHFNDGNKMNIYENLKYREEEDRVYVTGLIDKSAQHISIPGEINGKTVEIGSRAFANTELVSVALDEKIKTIPYEAFYNCTKLENINLDNIEHISEGAFQYCESLKDINLLNIKSWDGISETRLDTNRMTFRLIPYQHMIGYDPFSIYTIFYDAKIENLRIKWPEENFDKGAQTFPALFLRCEVKNARFENFTVSPSLAEFCSIDPSRRIKAVEPYVDLVKPSDEMVIYGNSDAVKEYAEKIGVKFEMINSEQ